MNIPEAVIQKFFKGECTGEEERRVRLYFREHPDELEKYMTEESWEATSNYPMPEELSAQMLKKIEAETSTGVARMRPWKWAAAAAVLVLGGSLLLWQSSSRQGPVTASVAVEKTTDSVVSKQNYSADTLVLALSDGTTMVLEPGSKVEYHQPFKDNRRDIYLQGNALFRVKNSRKRPFTVHAGHTSTTALGTVFSVHEGQSGSVNVKLYSGKVKVQARARAAKDSSQVVFLAPGQELVLASQSSEPLVRAFGERKLVKVDNSKKVILAMAEMQFTDEPLLEVFKRLETNNHLQIRFNEADLQDMSFTGVYQPTKETAESFLETVALLNGLTVKKEKNIYYINR